MNILSELKSRFRIALQPLVSDPTEALEMIRPAQDPKFGDYQANCAMPLGKQLHRPPREIATEIVAHLKIDDLCQTPLEIAGPGFINLKLRQEFISAQIDRASKDARLGIPPIATPK